MEENKILKYIAFTSTVNPGFWKTLTEIKLDVDKLSEERKLIWGKYTTYGLPNSTNIYFEVDSTSFNRECNYQNNDLPVRGYLINKNVIEDFKTCDKRGLLKEFSSEILNLWKTEEPFSDPSLLNNFILLTFADLKNFKYYYWFAFPSPLLNVNINVSNVSLLEEVFSHDLVSNLHCSYEKLTVQQKTFFILKSYKVTPLGDIKCLSSDSNLDNYYFVFSDPSKSSEHPGWPLNNYIAFILYHCPFLCGKELKFLALRLRLEQRKFTCKHSLVFTVTVPEYNIKEWIGWERNKGGKLLPQLASMKNSMDPKHLAEAAVDLNLRLMKWRLSPDLNLEKIRQAKCLVLGAGSLGRSVGLTLLGWGVRHISFIDSAFNENISKAESAAENLRKIFPGVVSKGHKLTIPMPGSPPVSESQISHTKKAVDTLLGLLCDHDVIFLSLDSQESRWLPTLLSSYYNKITINLAKGLNSYHVLRQGVNVLVDLKAEDTCESEAIPSHQLSCCFCTEQITRNGNSDQPVYGVSEIAGALATELAVSILQHPAGAAAPAKSNLADEDDGDCILGNLPHSIWGFLSDFNDQAFSVTKKHSQCIACSETVKNEFKSNEFDFLLKGFDGFEYLQSLTEGCFKFPTLNQDLKKCNLETISGKIKQTKCLLLGSGTLGCSVATTLSGWGVSHITFVDNSIVSYSNPVRQNLFTFENCIQNKSKAEAAAENLKKLFPDIETKGYKFTIPMPGHQVGETLLGETRQNVDTLVNLICDHDVVFLLMDSRESRWLPTLLGTYYKKIVINAALGFDSYLVMRHGITFSDGPDQELSPPTGYMMVPGQMLGCYFCSDVTAPGNSMQSRTLDQQCTVTRPGVSKIAGSLASLLAVSILQHPNGPSAPACYKSNPNAPDLDSLDKIAIGSLPHSIRGYLSNFSHIFPATMKYTQCVACSEFVTNEYAANGFEFLLKAFDSQKYLETLTGITEMLSDMPNLEDLDFDFEV